MKSIVFFLHGLYGIMPVIWMMPVIMTPGCLLRSTRCGVFIRYGQRIKKCLNFMGLRGLLFIVSGYNQLTFKAARFDTTGFMFTAEKLMQYFSNITRPPYDKGVIHAPGRPLKSVSFCRPPFLFAPKDFFIQRLAQRAPFILTRAHPNDRRIPHAA